MFSLWTFHLLCQCFCWNQSEHKWDLKNKCSLQTWHGYYWNWQFCSIVRKPHKIFFIQSFAKTPNFFDRTKVECIILWGAKHFSKFCMRNKKAQVSCLANSKVKIPVSAIRHLLWISVFHCILQYFLPVRCGSNLYWNL